MSENVCSAETFQAADRSTSGSFTRASTLSSETCAPPPTQRRPCDIEELTLNPMAITRTQGYTLVNGRFVAEPVNPGSRAISFRGLDGPRQRYIKVVGERSGTAAVTRVRAHLRVFAAHGAGHVNVRVERPGQPDLEFHCTTDRSFDFDVYRRESSAADQTLFERFFTLGIDPNRYRIHFESCGVRLSGRPVGSGYLDVLVYPQDQYTLTFSLPPLGRRAYSRASTLTVTDRQTDTTTREGGGFVRTNTVTQDATGTVTRERSVTGTETGTGVQHSDTWVQGRSNALLTGSSTTATNPGRPQPTLELKRNGVAEDVTVPISAIIRAVTSLERAVAAIRELLQNWVPQAGFRFEASISFFAGSISMGWGWKENPANHEVYFSWVATISVWLFKVGLSMSFGISAGPATIRVVAEIPEGAGGVNLQAQWELTNPNAGELPVSARAQGVLPLEARGEAVLDMYVARFERAAGVRSGFDAQGGTRLNDEFKAELYATVDWNGLDAFIRTQNPGEGVHEDVYHVIGKRSIYSGKMPF